MPWDENDSWCIIIIIVIIVISDEAAGEIWNWSLLGVKGCWSSIIFSDKGPMLKMSGITSHGIPLAGSTFSWQLSVFTTG